MERILPSTVLVLLTLSEGILLRYHLTRFSIYLFYTDMHIPSEDCEKANLLMPTQDVD